MTENQRIKEVRQSLGLTMEKFGDKIGVTKVAISNIEKANRNVTEQMRKSVCREFRVNETWLRTGEGEMFIELDPENQLMEWAADVLSSEAEDFRKRFLHMLMKMDLKDWESLEKMALILHEGNKTDDK